MSTTVSRRAFMAAAAAGAVGFAPRIARAAEPIRIGSLTPNTGGGAPFGPEITAAHRRVADLANANGGILGREIKLTQENSETNPETAIRAARKLVDANKVIAIIGTWSSSVTLGIMPLCQEANVIQMFTSSAAEIPQRNKKRLAFNFQPLSPVWGKAIAGLALKRGFKAYSVMALNNDFALSMVDTFVDEVKRGGATVAGTPFYYNGGQASYRAEVAKLLAPNPEAVFIPSFVTDFTAVYKEIYRAGYRGQVITISISVGPKFKEAVGAAANGVLHGFPVPALDSPAYHEYLKFVGLTPTGEVQHPFGTAGYDQMNVLLLAIESAKTDNTEVVKKHIHLVANPPGERVTNLLDGLKLLRAGKDINYSGASSEVDFQEDGSLVSRDFLLYEIKGGTDVQIERIRA